MSKESRCAQKLGALIHDSSDHANEANKCSSSKENLEIDKFDVLCATP